MIFQPKPVFWTDLQILDVLLSDAPDHLLQIASDKLVDKYHNTLFEQANTLYREDELLAEDTVSRTFIAALNDIGSADPDLLYWLRQILEKQFRIDTHQEISGIDDDTSDDFWSEWESEPTDFPLHFPSDGLDILIPEDEDIFRPYSYHSNYECN